MKTVKDPQHMKTYAIQTLLAATLVCAACAADSAALEPFAQREETE